MCHVEERILFHRQRRQNPCRKFKKKRRRMATSPDFKKLPVTVLSGFLGAGKCALKTVLFFSRRPKCLSIHFLFFAFASFTFWASSVSQMRHPPLYVTWDVALCLWTLALTKCRRQRPRISPLGRMLYWAEAVKGLRRRWMRWRRNETPIAFVKPNTTLQEKQLCLITCSKTKKG